MTDIPKTPPINPLRDPSAFAEVQWHYDFVVVFGLIPVERFKEYGRRFNTAKKAVFDLVLAEKFGATLVIARTEEIAEKARAIFAPVAAHGSGIAAWLAGPHVGMSSRFMARRLLGKDKVPTPNYPGSWRDWGDDKIYFPHDAHDLVLCFKLVEAVPELAERIKEMKGASPEWANVVKVWKRCEKLYYGQPDDVERWWEPITKMLQPEAAP